MPYRIGNNFVSFTNPHRSGAQGTIYPHPSDPTLVVKIYTTPTPEVGDKLKYLIANAPQCPRHPGTGEPLFGWPIELVYEQSGNVGGFTMHRIRDALSLAEIVNPIGRPSGITAEFLIHVAHGLAQRQADLHSVGYISGDINLTNDLVTRSGEVVRIDVDSMQVNTPTQKFRCGYGVYDCQAPELQNQNFKDVDHLVEHDRWALCVLLFQVFLSENPHNCQYTGPPPRPTLTDRIARGFWPYSGKHQEYMPPRGARPFGGLPSEIQNLFIRNFDLGHSDPAARPTADEWVAVLEALDRSCKPIPSKEWTKFLQGSSAPSPIASANRLMQVSISSSSMSWFQPPPISKPLLPRMAKLLLCGGLAALLLLAGVAIHYVCKTKTSHKVLTSPRVNRSALQNDDLKRTRLAQPQIRLGDLPDPTGPPNQPVLWKALTEKP
jgi:DNA-binding helix-hairpin-helix protein with protein kinase domain